MAFALPSVHITPARDLRRTILIFSCFPIHGERDSSQLEKQPEPTAHRDREACKEIGSSDAALLTLARSGKLRKVFGISIRKA